MTLEAALGQSHLFGMLPDTILARLAPWFELRSVAAGEVLLEEGTSSARLFILASGSVLVCKRVADETEALVARLGPGAHLGEIDLLDAETATASAVMESAGEVIELDADRFRRMLVCDRQLFTHIARVLFIDLAEKVRRTNDKVRETIAWGLDATGELS